jgi:hypothetical protein
MTDREGSSSESVIVTYFDVGAEDLGRGGGERENFTFLRGSSTTIAVLRFLACELG